VTFSLTSAGSPDVPRHAEAWVRSTALGALDACVDEVVDARTRAADQFAGASGLAYSAHTGQMLLHLQALRARFVRAADLFSSYADRLVAHEALLAGVRSRALAAGLEVVGDRVLPPDDAADLLTGVTWSELAGEVLDEHRDLATWVATHLEGAVESFRDESLVRWVRAFVEDYASTLVSTATEGVLTGAGQLAGRFADDLARLGRLPGPVGLAYDAVTALQGETPAEGLFTAGVGFTTATVAVATLPVTAPTAAVVGTTILATVGGVLVAEKAWDRLPDEATEILDEAAEDAWDAGGDWVGERWEEVGAWLPG
jgi:hypothetical protein